ncbi:hypothetical protein FSP39_021217 [Pinctada imbricata]|uniref:Cholesterol side-chain cleavage enzyme, mitochondrial n=1 Tax=Pinctada imbricata TaxID=66713 RepID=A0AA88XJ42_PINIB|nr:hypothetical protein FSP39_021217 [Pinctada imbricata]
MRRMLSRVAKSVQNSCNGRSVSTSSERSAAVASAINRLEPSSVSMESNTKRTLADLDGPQGYPVLGTAPEYFRKANRGKMHEVQRQFHQKYGKMFKERLGPVTNVSIADPKIVEELIRQEGKYPLRPPYESWLLYKKLRSQKAGVMSAVGEEWHRYRTALSQKLLRPRNVHEYVDIMNEVVTSLVQRIRYLRDHEGEGSTVPALPNELCKWAAESIGAVLFEDRLGCLENQMAVEVQDFIEAVGKMFLTGHQLMVFAEMHKKLGTKPWKTHVQSWDTIYRVAEKLINKSLDEMKRGIDVEDHDVKGSAFLGHLLTGTKLSIEEIYTCTTELFLSGVDTSSNALGFAIYLLARNPRVQERMYPVIPINARVTTADITLNGYLIPKDTCILLNAYTMAYDEQHFSRAEEFIPERWLRSESKDVNPFSMLPFGFGSRMCVGRRIAEQELYLALIRIAQNFWLEPASKYELKPVLRTVLSLGEQIPVQFKDR